MLADTGFVLHEKNTQDIAERARSLPGIVESLCHDIATDHGRLRVLALTGPGASRIQQSPPDWLGGIDVILPVTALPTPDELAAMPLWSAQARSTAEADLAVRLDVPKVALGLAWDLTPVARAPLGRVRTAVAETSGKPVRAAIGERLSDTPAMIDGGTYRAPEGHPETLAEGILRIGTSDTKIVAYRPDGTVERLSYPALLDRAQRLQAGLQAQGLRMGDIVLCDVTDPIACVAAIWGAVLAGIVPAPIALPERDAPHAAFARLNAAAQLLNHPPLLVAPGAAQGRLAGLITHDIGALCKTDNPGCTPAAIVPEDPAIILLTSGSTGTPKGVVQTHKAIVTMIGAVPNTSCKQTQVDPIFNWMPRDHVGSVVLSIFGGAVYGATQIHADTAHILADPARWLDIVSREGAALTWSPNFSFALIAKAARATPKDWDLSSLRALFNGGETVTEDSLNDFCAALAPYSFGGTGVIIPSLGTSETCSAVTLGRLGAPRGPFTSLGTSAPGSRIRAVDDTGALLCEGEIGRIELASPQLLSGYHGLDTPATSPDGWYDTGDLGFIAGGELYLTGRLKDTVNVNGATYFVHELEAALADLPGLERSAIAVTSVRLTGDMTERMAVFFAMSPEEGVDDPVALSAMATAIRDSMGKHLSLTPDLLVPLHPGDLPRTSIGKIVRRTLQTRYGEGAYDGAIQRLAQATGTMGHEPVALHRRCWQPAVPPRKSPRDRVTLLYTDSADMGGLAKGHRLIALPDTGAPALGEVAGQTLLLLAASCDPARPEDLRAFSALSRLADSVDALPATHRPARVIVVTQGSLAAASGDTIVPGQAILVGLVRSLTTTMPDVAWHLSDIATANREAELQAILGTAEPISAFRDAGWLAPRWVDEALQKPMPVAGRTWIVTGGLGGIGRMLCPDLLDDDGALIVIGRTPETALAGVQAESLAALRRSGPVTYIGGDFGAADMPDRIAAAEASLGRTATGLIHLAATLPPEGASGISYGLEHSWRQALAMQDMVFRLGRERPGLQLLRVGSIVGQLGGSMAGYAAMNSALAERAQGTDGAGLELSSIDLSCWEDRGMSLGRTNRALLHADGLLPLGDAAGLALLAHARQAGAGLRIGGMDARHPRHGWRVHGQPGRPVLRASVWAEGAGSTGAVCLRAANMAPHWGPLRRVDAIPLHGDGTLDEARLSLGGTPDPKAEQDPVARVVALAMAEELERTRVPVSGDFFAMGGTSLQAARLSQRLSELLFVELSLSAIFQAPSPTQVAALLRKREAESGLTDAAAAEVLEVFETSARQPNTIGPVQ
jgi:acyl-CoA synthetase (AMP-forming)/AMP-acid ligase II